MATNVTDLVGTVTTATDRPDKGASVTRPCETVVVDTTDSTNLGAKNSLRTSGTTTVVNS